MTDWSHTFRQFVPPVLWRKWLVILAKMFVVSATLYVLFTRVNAKELWDVVGHPRAGDTEAPLVLFFVFLTVLNFLLDALLWKKISDANESVSLSKAAFHHLRSLALAVITPYNVGEFGGKYRQHTTAIAQLKAVYLTYIFRFVKMSARNLVGSFALLYLTFNKTLVLLNTGQALIIVLAAAVVVFIYFHMQRAIPLIANIPIRGKKYLLPLQRILPSMRSRILWLLLGIVKFLVYPSQFVLMLLLFAPSIDATYSLLAMVLVYYSVAAFLPSMQIIDPLVKGGAGVYILSSVASSEVVVVAAALVWFVNVAIPAGVGALLFMRKSERGVLHDSAH